tara:strand:+ start:1989 stop:2165 length:177 start_codon:yes stop_codon:yes gene_type:complete
MSATQALKSEAFIERHKEIKEKTQRKAEEFEEKHEYNPPYWQMVRMAEESTQCFFEVD